MHACFAQQTTVQHVDEFKRIWSDLDPDADGLISLRSLPKLVAETPYPLGLHGSPHQLNLFIRADVVRFVKQLKLSVWSSGKDAWIVYHETLDAFIMRCMPNIQPAEMRKFIATSTHVEQLQQLEIKQRETALGRVWQQGDAVPGERNSHPISEVYAVVVIQTRARAALEVFRARRKQEGELDERSHRSLRAWTALCRGYRTKRLPLV